MRCARWRGSTPSRAEVEAAQGERGLRCRPEPPFASLVLAEAARDSRSAAATEVVRTAGGERKIKTPKLGDVGGTIIVETFAEMMLADRHSFWNVDPLWRPTLDRGGAFTLREFVLYALGG
jgi:hypothetical protein